MDAQLHNLLVDLRSMRPAWEVIGVDFDNRATDKLYEARKRAYPVLPDSGLDTELEVGSLLKLVLLEDLAQMKREWSGQVLNQMTGKPSRPWGYYLAEYRNDRFDVRIHLSRAYAQLYLDHAKQKFPDFGFHILRPKPI